MVGGISEFPEARFDLFVSRLKIQSKDVGIVPFVLNGAQRYIQSRLVAGMARGVSTFYILKARQIGCTTYFLAVDMFWAFEHKGLLGSFVIHKEEAREDWRQTIDNFYDCIPGYTKIDGVEVKLKPSKVRHNRSILSFSNGSRFR